MNVHAKGFCGPVAVLGAGIQGCLIALELAERAIRVVLYEAAPAPMSAASRWNEGKIHLGYLFANDPTGKTAAAMIEGGTAFSAMADRYLGAKAILAARSSPFTYAVHTDSILTPDQYAAHAAKVGEMVGAQAGQLGPAVRHEDAPLFERMSDADLCETYDPERIIGAVRTCEVSLNPHVLADALAAAVASHPRITLLTNTRVHQVSRDDTASLTVHAGGSGGDQHRARYRHVVNALWADRLRIDAGLGLAPTRPWLFRYKVAAHARLSAPAPVGSTTLVLGPFGDIVNFGEHLYLSWYPAGRIGSSTALVPPNWASTLTPEVKDTLWDAYVRALGAIDKNLSATPLDRQNADIEGGVIFTWGDTDVDDPNGEVHQRFDIGPHTVDGYTTVDTGKWGMAALFARETADRIAPAIKTYAAAKPDAPPPAIDVLIPAYNAEAFLHETLDSLLAQTFTNFRAIVSVDVSTDTTAEIARRYAAQDARFVVIEQTKRQGWVGAANALLERVTAERFLFLFHDDQIPPDFFAVLNRALDAHSDALGVGPRTLGFGERDEVIEYDIPGQSLEARLTGQIARYGKAGHAVRGVLMHARAIADGLHIPHGYGPSGRGSSALYDVVVARLGATVMIPEARYTKRFWDGSTTANWRKSTSDGVSIDQRADFGFDVLEAVLAAPLDTETRLALSRDVVKHCAARLKKDGATPGKADDPALVAALFAMKARGEALEEVTAAMLARILAKDARKADEDVQALLQRARAAAQTGDMDKAQKSLAQARKLAPDAADVLAWSAEIALRSGDTADAASYAAHALDGDPHSARALSLAAECALRQGDRARARSLAERALAQNDANKRAKRVLAKASGA